MGVRNAMILFFSAMAVSMVILIVFFSLFFKNFDNLITFDTKLPETAPDLGTVFDPTKTPESSRVEGVEHSTINVPMEGGYNSPATGKTASLETEETLEPAVGVGVPGMTTSEENPDHNPDATTSAYTASPNGEGAKPQGEPPAIRDTKRPTGNPSGVSGNGPMTVPANIKPSNTTEPAAPKASAPKPGGVHQVYLDGFGSKEDAQKAAEAMRAKGLNPVVKESKGRPVVQLGTFGNAANANALAEKTGGKVKSAAPAAPVPPTPQ